MFHNILYLLSNKAALINKKNQKPSIEFLIFFNDIKDLFKIEFGFYHG